MMYLAVQINRRSQSSFFTVEPSIKFIRKANRTILIAENANPNVIEKQCQWNEWHLIVIDSLKIEVPLSSIDYDQKKQRLIDLTFLLSSYSRFSNSRFS